MLMIFDRYEILEILFAGIVTDVIEFVASKCLDWSHYLRKNGMRENVISILLLSLVLSSVCDSKDWLSCV